MMATKSEGAALVAGGVAALLGSTCCLGPLVLVALGFSGAWIGNLSRLEPYRPVFIGAALVALTLAGWRLYRPRARCDDGRICARPAVSRAYRTLFWAVVVLVTIALAFPYVMPAFY